MQRLGDPLLKTIAIIGIMVNVGQSQFQKKLIKQKSNTKTVHKIKYKIHQGGKKVKKLESFIVFGNNAAEANIGSEIKNDFYSKLTLKLKLARWLEN